MRSRSCLGCPVGSSCKQIWCAAADEAEEDLDCGRLLKDGDIIQFGTESKVLVEVRIPGRMPLGNCGIIAANTG